MSITYTVNDWIAAMKGVSVVGNAPGETPESTTLTSASPFTIANGEFEDFATLASKLMQVPKTEIQD